MSVSPSDSQSNLVDYSVSEISGSIKRTVENAFGRVRVRGEVSGYRGPHSSGHAYFSMKDERARIEAVIWRGAFSKLKFKPEEGMEMIATGKVTTYAGSSKYQIVIEALEPAGAGALMALLEERRRKLAAEGFFEEARKRALPFMPRVVGVVTSPTGAVIRDILHRVRDRFPVHVVVWPVRVQGETSGAEVAAAISGFNALDANGLVARPDVIIVARGGGSLEDLWGFNDEAVVRAAAASTIPLISAVGHETDWTLIDHVADRRAPTPTGAAEIAVPVKADLEADLAGLSARLRAAATRSFDAKRQAVRSLVRALPSLDMVLAMPRRRFDETAGGLPRALTFNTLNKRRAFERRAGLVTPAALLARIREKRQTLNEHTARCARAMERRSDMVRAGLQRFDQTLAVWPARVSDRLGRSRGGLKELERRADRAIDLYGERHSGRIVAVERLLVSLSYKSVLQRGFAIVRDDADRPVPAAAGLAPGSPVSIEFSDGRVDAVTAGSGSPARRAKSSGRSTKTATKDSQADEKPVQGQLI